MTPKLFGTALVAQLLVLAAVPCRAQDKPATATPPAKARAADEPKAVANKFLPRTPERFLEIVEMLKATEKYEPKNGSTYCNFFARDFVKELLGQPLPELTGQANEQLTKMAASPDWKKGILVYGPDAVTKGHENLKGMTAKELQPQQDAAKLVLYCWKHPDWSTEMPREQRQKLHGHIAVGMPLKPGDSLASDEVWGTKDNPALVPMTTQSGSKVFAYGKLSQGFGAKRKNDILVFIYKNQGTPSSIAKSDSAEG